MKAKGDKIELNNNKFYIRKNINRKGMEGQTIFVEVDKKEFEDFVADIAKRIIKQNKVTIEEILIAALKSSSLNAINKIDDALKAKKEIRKVTGCVQLNFGSDEDATIILAI